MRANGRAFRSVFVDSRNLSKSFLHYNLAFLVITGVTETEFAVQLLCGFVSVDIFVVGTQAEKSSGIALSGGY